ncbi:unnamed protein product [Didymodactylos carnosus]|uniref:Autophagy-related protein 27 n=1 Tax=Didymodactylos carnosus TaxID=1234261 RepID=A0A815L1N6_9BILA|nr:unnamed protein product [Didymodactylos carnosus]CAF1403832.1 unnamed protein product [Didymodactylos carnosus]CAF3877635.1 unnamed protein product [Didymodactylos carnosus]CAF4296250.1 unnamed protein product [Didymodactylos carnosus]
MNQSFFIISILICCSYGADDPCKYTAKQGTIDLTSVGFSNGEPAFKDAIAVEHADGYMYSFNPCKPFSEESCHNVAGCQVSKDLKLSFTIGMHDTVSWVPGVLGGIPSLKYTAPGKSLTVDLKCVNDGSPDQIHVSGETSMNNYELTLSTKCACWNVCKKGPGPGPGKKKGLSGGAVVIIITICLLFVYIVGTISYNKFHLKQTGVELIPHRTFWIALPGYAKDGVVHSYKTIRGGKGTGYQSV